ncbi:putative head outer capsid decoration protein [Klebsiella phage vB_KaeM_Merci]|nr:putative head outer capsid decoration protein [Klebsiella phage vB_KaeM_Merci]
MAYSVSIAPLAASAVIGATTNFTATTSGAAAEGTETTLTVQNKTMPAITLTLSPTSVSKEIGQSQVVTADVTGAPSGASIAYVWKRGSSVISGQTGKTITLTESTEISYTLNCEVTVSAPDYNNGTTTKGIVVVFTKKGSSYS